MLTLPTLKTTEIFTDRYVSVKIVEETKILICETLTTFIPMEAFKGIFGKITGLVKDHKITKIIFDKRSLTTFHQPSMEWYHLNWKQEVFTLGLKSHRKLLPNDSLFRKSVEIGRAKIQKEHPTLDLKKFDIQYFDSIEEAIEK